MHRPARLLAGGVGVLCVLAGSASALSAQTRSPALPMNACAVLGSAVAGPVVGVTEDLRRMAALAGTAELRSITVRRGSDVDDTGCDAATDPPLYGIGAFGLHVAPLRAAGWYNGGYPDDRETGFVWAGRGLSAMASGGIAVDAGIVRAAFLPALAFQQNGTYTIRPSVRPGYPEYANPYYGTIDLPQRMGTDAFWEMDWAGQSYARVDAFGAAVGIAHENFLVGPSIRNPILMSGTASGFTHLFAGTSRPLDLRIVSIDASVVVGRLEESDHFDSMPENDQSGLAMWTVGLQPNALPGLEVGIARAYMTRRDEGELFDFGGLADVLALGSETNLGGNEIASLFARWVFTEAHAEVYGEWARDDRFAGLSDDFLPEPDHSQAYSFGFQKLTPVGDGAIRVQAELNHLQEKQETRAGRPLPVYYTHSGVRQGYTHRGQMLGAGIGPGADAQFVAADWMRDWGYAGLFLERVRRNDGSRAAIDARWTWPYEHDTELTAGLRGLFVVSDMSAAASVSWSRRLYRDFIVDRDDNVRMTLELTGSPLRMLRR